MQKGVRREKKGGPREEERGCREEKRRNVKKTQMIVYQIVMLFWWEFR
jgi:hypothetical protein